MFQKAEMLGAGPMAAPRARIPTAVLVSLAVSFF